MYTHTHRLLTDVGFFNDYLVHFKAYCYPEILSLTYKYHYSLL